MQATLQLHPDHNPLSDRDLCIDALDRLRLALTAAKKHMLLIGERPDPERVKAAQEDVEKGPQPKKASEPWSQKESRKGKSRRSSCLASER